MSSTEHYICEPEDHSAGQPATFIFLHGFGDDGEGLPLALAQQFQFNHKLPYLRWLLPNSGYNSNAMNTAWYKQKPLPTIYKPLNPGEDSDETEPDDEIGILKAVDRLDQMVKEEMDRGVPINRIVVGGFSQGCVISLLWGLISPYRNEVAGIVPLSGYFALADRVVELRKENGVPEEDKGTVKWFFAHGGRDSSVGTSYFNHGKEQLAKYVNFDRDVEAHLYEGMGHTTAPPELRDMLAFLTGVIPP